MFEFHRWVTRNSPEVMFEKKGLIPAMLHLLVETNTNP
jgi:hypothetical protein